MVRQEFSLASIQHAIHQRNKRKWAERKKNRLCKTMERRIMRGQQLLMFRQQCG